MHRATTTVGANSPSSADDRKSTVHRDGGAPEPDVRGHGTYQRYHIETRETPDIEPWPSRFKVKVGKIGLAKLLIRELIQYRGDLDIVLSRPCVYGVFSGPVGGFAPREEKCVGCLRCTTQHPEFVEVRPNPQRQRLGDAYFTSSYVDAVAYEAATGRIPVKGAGYRGRFGGEGWDGMWTDMSEIVRPTRDGIHGREFISTVVDVGSRPAFLCLDEAGQPEGPLPQTFAIPLPMIFDVLPASVTGRRLRQILSSAAAAMGSLAILPITDLLEDGLAGGHLVPLVMASQIEKLKALPFAPRMIAMAGWDAHLYEVISRRFPEALLSLRIPFADGEALAGYAEAGVRVFHLTADYHGRAPGGGQVRGNRVGGSTAEAVTTSGGRTDVVAGKGAFLLNLIREAHLAFVERGMRDEVTLLGSGGIIAAEHVPKAIIAGLDVVALDTALLVALQARFDGDFRDSQSGGCRLPEDLTVEWGRQRLLNLMAAWRDQLLEVLGAMGLREVRRLRGEMGRAMFQRDLEREAFSGIEGYAED